MQWRAEAVDLGASRMPARVQSGTVACRQAGIGWLLALVLALCLASWALAGSGPCAHCGHAETCRKVCRLVPREQKVFITCWGCKCEEFCVPGPSHIACVHRDQVCDDGNSDPHAPCLQPRPFVWKEWLPGGSQGIHTRKRLMRKTETKQLPGFEWVVEDLCGHCESQARGIPLPASGNLPPLPASDAGAK